MIDWEEAQELNKKVALKLGWTFTPAAPCLSEYWTLPTGVDCVIGSNPYFVLPDFSRSIEAAWVIVKYLNSNQFTVILNMDSWGKNSCNIHELREYRMVATEFSDRAPEAIVRAFLKLP